MSMRSSRSVTSMVRGAGDQTGVKDQRSSRARMRALMGEAEHANYERKVGRYHTPEALEKQRRSRWEIWLTTVLCACIYALLTWFIMRIYYFL